MAEHVRRADRDTRHAHRLAGPEHDDATPSRGVIIAEDRSHVGAALGQLDTGERQVILAHEVEDSSVASIARELGSTSGAVAARLARTRAKLRVEYLLEREQVELPTESCRPVLRAVSAGDRRRQEALDAHGHLLACEACTRIATMLRTARAGTEGDDEARVAVAGEADVLTARESVRAIAERAGFGSADLTLLATAVSELARNILEHAGRGEVVVRGVQDDGRHGVRVIARDAGPGIPDVEAALRDGYSTSAGMGLGLPGARRLVDSLDVVSEPGRGTTVTMAKWRAAPSTGHEHPLAIPLPAAGEAGQAGSDGP